MLLKKTLRPSIQKMLETACLPAENYTREKPTEIRPVYIKKTLSGNFELSNIENFSNEATLKGSMLGVGTEWNWKVLQFTMTASNGALIHDMNMVVGNKLIGRKQVFDSNGTPVMLMDVDMLEISLDEFKNKSIEMKCPSFPELN
jgi:hypothetical protein